MDLYSDFLIKIELAEESNIGCVQWLETQNFDMAAYEDSFHIMMNYIEQYKIRKLIFKSSSTMIHLPDDQYFSIISLLQSGFAHSRMEKVARIYVDKSKRDIECILHFEKLLNEMQLEISFKNFENRKEALTWLKEK